MKEGGAVRLCTLYGATMNETMDRTIFRQTAPTVAMQLLGFYLVHETRAGRAVGRIVETEAYCEEDPASHTYKGKTRRNRAMFGPAGHAYIYQIHGHHCFNCTAGRDGYGAGSLVRALEPVEGIDLMRSRRSVQQERALCSGPGKLTQAMGITMEQYGIDLLDTGSPLRLEAPEAEQAFTVVHTSRIGVSRAKELRRRFYIEGNPYLSRK